MDSLAPRWRQQRTETTHGRTHSAAVDAICLCCLTHGACVKVTGLQPLLTTALWRLPVAHVKEDG